MAQLTWLWGKGPSLFGHRAAKPQVMQRLPSAPQPTMQELGTSLQSRNQRLENAGPHLGILVGVDSALHAEGLRAQDFTVPLQCIQLKKAGGGQQLQGRQTGTCVWARLVAQASGNTGLPEGQYTLAFLCVLVL